MNTSEEYTLSSLAEAAREQGHDPIVDTDAYAVPVVRCTGCNHHAPPDSVGRRSLLEPCVAASLTDAQLRAWIGLCAKGEVTLSPAEGGFVRATVRGEEDERFRNGRYLEPKWGTSFDYDGMQYALRERVLPPEVREQIATAVKQAMTYYMGQHGPKEREDEHHFDRYAEMVEEAMTSAIEGAFVQPRDPGTDRPIAPYDEWYDDEAERYWEQRAEW